jgi:hypothetical protein
MKMLEDPRQNEFTRTWMLFESGNSVSVDLSLFSAPKENIRPIDAYVVTEAEGTVTYSARRAAGAVYEVIRDYRSDIGPVVAGFDFKANFPVTGESGGLAFAVALAKRLLNKDPGPVAATGIVESSHNGGPIKRVRGVEAKLKAASLALPSGGWVFYPEENENEISAELRSRLISKGLKLYPVSSVSQTIKILFANKQFNKDKPGQRINVRKTVLMIFLLSLILLTPLVVFILWQGKQFPHEHHKIENSGSISDQAEIEIDEPDFENKSSEIQEDKDPEERIRPRNGAETETETEDMDSNEIEKPNGFATINIFGRTRLNAEISRVLTTKLKDFFALPHHHLGHVENVFISGQVIVLRIEENWIEERQSFRSNIRVALRDFVYEDKNRKFEQPYIEVTVHARGMVEDMLPLAAQELMNKMLNSLFSDDNENYIEDLPA